MRFIFLPLLFFGGTFVSLAQSPEEVFARANDLYQQTKFVEARDLYESLIQNGYGSGELYYNLGNACYKTGNIARAILNYERALKQMPTDDDLQHNLQLANLMITDKIEPAPRLFIWDYWDAIKAGFSIEGITWLVYLLFVAVVTASIVMMLARTYRTRKIALLGGVVSGCLLVFALVIFAARVSDLKGEDTAIIVAEIVTTKNSPDTKSTDAFVLHSGVKVEIVDRLNDWVKIRLADGKVGWVEKTAAEVI
ncbi:MAG: hypothetical protein HW407_1432 [Bacteroidetes bacterium]|nr:hypothetical protein [Bacteroidota bacterium]